MKALSIYLLVSIISLATLWGCKKKTATVSAKKAAIEVWAVPVTQQEIREYLTFNGVSVYQRKEDIRSNVTGYISSMRHEIGDNIRAGQVFAYVRTKEQDALRDAVKIDSSLAKFINPISIKSNATGIISVLNVNKNDYVAEGDIIASVVQPKSLVVKVNVPFEYKESVQIAAPCELLLPNGKTINATITETLPTIDVQSQAQTFLVDLPEADLPENLNIQVKLLQKESSNAMSIPKTALQTNELLTKYWVMKVVDDSLAIKTEVHPLLKNDSLVQIQSERVQLNDWVITEGAYQMQDSTLVKIIKR
ncbi:HlyD family secretion protein [Salegentibacter echinorum]|uniref:HlyD family secretion protein n=1 Tax=Salegentibacter echinorum TaxID=1073325 RepID=A0A1M5K3R2_SALEC|nr:HlyD family efflux transporter periplasmic adaptor subunit [Salegentibacter echinorum]SHG47139.1 HlyD family secretion protein [Salegentibacter echinorum]